MQWLGLAWLVVIVLELVRGRSPTLDAIATGIWACFVIDFLVRLLLAPKRAAFLKRNWLTLLSIAVPAVRALRAIRVLRVLRIVRWSRIVRIAGSVNRGAAALRTTLARRRIAYAAGLTVVVWIIGSASLYAFERDVPGTAFADLGTVVWWTAMMLTTMGSESWPVTPEGRVLSFALAVYAFAVFGYITASLATLFIGREPQTSS